MTTTALIALAVIAAIVIIVRGWMADNARVRAEVEALTDVPLHLKADILDCLDAAAAAGGGNATWPTSGGAGGAAVVGDAYITWINTGTRYGAIT